MALAHDRRWDTACTVLGHGAQVSEAKVTSFFYWENKLEADTEATLVMKTPAALFLPLEREVRRLHSDDVPQIVAVPIVAGNEGYLKWMVETTTPPDSSKAE
eukprot:Polyplicarium_translucidae@DN2463_c0_g1_i2.p2